jgi:RNA polymerase sigma-70 factor (ECF subfamily)
MLDSLVERAVAEAVAAWPSLPVPTFAQLLRQKLGEQSSPPELWFSRLHAADLYLATACAQRVPGAADAFDRTYRPDLVKTARRFQGPLHPLDDLVQLMLFKLLVGSEERRPRIAEYSGQGWLQNWLRVTTVRLCLDAVKGGAQHKREKGTDELVAVDLSDDLELDFIKKTYRAHFKSAFARAVSELDTTERTLLKLSTLHGLTIDELASVFHVHRATAARRVARAREALIEHTRKALREALSLRDEELDSILGIISRPEVSLERLLRTTFGARATDAGRGRPREGNVED